MYSDGVLRWGLESLHHVDLENLENGVPVDATVKQPTWTRAYNSLHLEYKVPALRSYSFFGVGNVALEGFPMSMSA